MTAIPTTASGIAGAVRSGSLTARQVIEYHLSAIAVRDGELHAFNIVTADEARAAADTIDGRVARGEDPGPLAGVPIAIKDVIDAFMNSIINPLIGAIVGKPNLDNFLTITVRKGQADQAIISVEIGRASCRERVFKDV